MRKKVILFATFFILVVLSLSSKSTLAASNNLEMFNKSGLNKGVIGVHYQASKNVRAKLMIQKENNKYFYNLSSNGNFPLQLGSGEYTVAVLENSINNEYIVVKSEKINVQLKDINQVYLNSIQNVNWNKEMSAIKEAQQMTSNLKTDKEKVQVIYDYIIKNIKYDDDKINHINGDYVPSIEDTLKSSNGICYDYASLFAAMLRSVDVPTKLVKGYKNDIKTYHAWNQVYLNDEWVTIDTTYDSNLNSENLDYSMIKNSNEYSVSKEY